jgi:hypothetical protein
VIVTLCAPATALDPTVIVTVAFVPGVMDAGCTATVTPVGALAVRATAFFAVPLSVAPMVNVTELPTCTVPAVADAVKAKSTLGAGLAPEPHALTSNAPSTEPSPVARLYAPPLAVNPACPGTLLLPEGVA